MISPWPGWSPDERAVLCFICRDGKVLLIRKLRGLGAGKMNAPGGKIDPGETPEEAAVRETQEEICVTPLGLRHHGAVHFQFADGYKLDCQLFVADRWTGEPRATEEAIPFWFRLEEIPYSEMWQDDRHWLPGMLAGAFLQGWFHFDGEKMLSHEIYWKNVLT